MQDSNTTPQFATAEYSGIPETQRCSVCQQLLGAGYYRANGNAVCSSCADKMRNRVPDGSHGPFFRAMIFGLGAAVLGLIIYSAFGILTGWVIGYLSLAVGYIIGKAMMKGSGGVGGRRYQIAAVLFTYAAVSLSAVPIGIGLYTKEARAKQKAEQPAPPNAGQQPAAATPAQASPVSLVALLAKLAMLGLVSPFLGLQEPLQGLIGLVILFVGMQIAWKSTAGKPALTLSGPY